jgi:hypothetical protein
MLSPFRRPTRSLLPTSYFVRTQPHRIAGEIPAASSAGAKSVYLIMPEPPFTETVFKAIATVEPKASRSRRHRQQERIDEMVRAV